MSSISTPSQTSRASLPGSSSSHPHRGRVVSHEPQLTFSTFVSNSADYLPHLRNVKSASRSSECLLTRIDQCADPHHEMHEPKHLFSGPFKAKRIQEFCVEDPNSHGADTRLIFVENLSSTVMEALVTGLNISLEFFEAYLVNSGWNDNRYSDKNPKTWPTARLGKQYTTIQWRRPVRYNLADINNHVMEMLNTKVGKTTWRGPGTTHSGNGVQLNSDAVSFTIESSANVLRDFHTMEPLATVEDESPSVAWNERAAIWSGNVAGRQYVVALFDPIAEVELMSSSARSVRYTLPGRRATVQKRPTSVYQSPRQLSPTSLSSGQRSDIARDTALASPDMTGDFVSRHEPRGIVYQHSTTVVTQNEEVHVREHRANPTQSIEPSTVIQDSGQDETTVRSTREVVQRRHTINTEMKATIASHTAQTGPLRKARSCPGMIPGLQSGALAGTEMRFVLQPTSRKDLEKLLKNRSESDYRELLPTGTEILRRTSDIDVNTGRAKARPKQITTRQEAPQNLNVDVDKRSRSLIEISVPRRRTGDPDVESNRPKQRRSTRARKIATKTRHIVVYDDLFIRGQPKKLPFSYQEMTQMTLDSVHRHYTRQLASKSTSEAVQHLLLGINSLDTNESCLHRLRKTLIGLVCQDLQGVCEVFQESLRQLNRQMLEKGQLEPNLSKWQGFLEVLEQDLMIWEDDLNKFAREDPMPGSNDAGARGPQMTQQLTTTEAVIHEVRQALKECRTSLMTNLSILESQRGVAQAESVTRLTEIGFVFIPLTFAASIFSMQVHELDPSTTSVKGFVAVAVILLLALYSIRLLIRSEFFKAVRKDMVQDLRSTGGVKPSQEIPNTLVLIWTWQKSRTLLVGLITRPTQVLGDLLSTTGKPFLQLVATIVGNQSVDLVLSAVIVLTIVAFAPLWTSSLERSIKVAITICLCVPGSWAVALFAAHDFASHLLREQSAPRGSVRRRDS